MVLIIAFFIFFMQNVHILYSTLQKIGHDVFNILFQLPSLYHSIGKSVRVHVQ